MFAVRVQSMHHVSQNRRIIQPLQQNRRSIRHIINENREHHPRIYPRSGGRHFRNTSPDATILRELHPREHPSPVCTRHREHCVLLSAALKCLFADVEQGGRFGGGYQATDHPGDALLGLDSTFAEFRPAVFGVFHLSSAACVI
jgi:hypothetical protein